MRIVLLVLAAILFLLPVYMMVVYSFTPVKGFVTMPPSLIPLTPTLRNYQTISELPLIGRWLVNTVIVTASMIIGAVLINGAAGYAFAFSRARGLRVLFWVMLSALFITRYSLLIPQFVVVSKLHLSGLPAAVIMSLFWPVGIYLFKTYFASIPHSLLESARIDGAGEGAILMRVVLPMSKPMIGSAIVFVGLWAMQDFIWQMLVLQWEESRTLLVGLISSIYQVGGSGSHAIRNIGYDLAVGTVLFVPLLAIFAVSSRYFTEGLKGAVKE